MAIDPQTVTIALGALSTAIAAVVTGIISGRNTRHKDQLNASIALDQSRLLREKAEADASKLRIEAIANDNTELRLRLRTIESDYEQQLRELRLYARNGWDTANYHFNLLSVVSHHLANIFQVAIAGDLARIAQIVSSTEQRMKTIRVPVAVDDVKTINAEAGKEAPS